MEQAKIISPLLEERCITQLIKFIKTIFLTKEYELKKKINKILLR